MAPGANIGEEYAIFEAVHGTAPDIAGQNKANPTALIQSAIMMLRHLDLKKDADKLEKALLLSLNYEKRTGDLGGKGTTDDFTNMIIKNLEAIK